MRSMCIDANNHRLISLFDAAAEIITKWLNDDADASTAAADDDSMQ